MPLISNEPLFGRDNLIDCVVINSDNSILKYHNTIIMDKNNPSVLLSYGMEPLQESDDSGNITILSLPLMFQIQIRFLNDESNSKSFMIQYSRGNDDNNTTIVNLINWSLKSKTDIVDIITPKKDIIDCGNGVKISLQMRICNAEQAYVIDTFLYSKLEEE